MHKEGHKSDLEIALESLEKMGKRGLRSSASATKVLKEIGILDGRGNIAKPYRKEPIYKPRASK